MTDQELRLDLDELRALATEDNSSNEDRDLAASFEYYDVDFAALAKFGVSGMADYIARIDAGEIDPLQALMGMWFGGTKMGILIRDEQRRRVMESFEVTRQEVTDLPSTNPEEDGDGA